MDLFYIKPPLKDSTALLEESDEVQETWSRLLVNAGEAATEMARRQSRTRRLVRSTIDENGDLEHEA